MKGHSGKPDEYPSLKKPGISIILTLVLAASLASSARAQWEIVSVDSNHNAGGWISTAFGPDQGVHLSYLTLQDNNYMVTYTPPGTKGWSPRIIGQDALATRETSLGLDSQGRAYITYFYDGEIKYATNASGEWRISTIDQGFPTGGCPRLAMGPADSVHITYVNQSMEVAYAHNTSGSWEYSTVPDSYTSASTCLAVDQNGAVHVGYLTLHGYSYAELRGGAWSTTMLDPTKPNANGVYGCTVCLGLLGEVYSLYRSQAEMRYFERRDGGWTMTSPIDLDVSATGYSSLYMDKNYRAHAVVAATNGLLPDLYYCRQDSPNWPCELVAERTGILNSILVDDLGNVYIAAINPDTNLVTLYIKRSAQ